MTVGDNIKKLRLEKGLTQKELGDLCGMADSAIRRYESGRGNPTDKTLMRIASALKVPREVLLFECSDNSYLEEWAGAPLFSSVDEKEKHYSKIRSTLEDRDYNRITEFVYSVNGRLIISAYSELNETGQKEAIKRIVELTELKQYKLKRPVEQNPNPTSDFDNSETKDTDNEKKPFEGTQTPQDGE